MARRITIVVSFVVALILTTSVPVNAVSDSDADDVEGPLDLRWVGASLTQDSEFRVTISFYDGFRVSAQHCPRCDTASFTEEATFSLISLSSSPGFTYVGMGRSSSSTETSAQAAGPTSRVRANEHG